MAQHHLVPCSNFTAAGKILSETLLLLFGHFFCPPLDLLLYGAELLDLTQPALNRLLGVPISFALFGGKKGELEARHCPFEPVKPVVIHLREDHKEETS